MPIYVTIATCIWSEKIIYLLVSCNKQLCRVAIKHDIFCVPTSSLSSPFSWCGMCRDGEQVKGSECTRIVAYYNLPRGKWSFSIKYMLRWRKRAGWWQHRPARATLFTHKKYNKNIELMRVKKHTRTDRHIFRHWLRKDRRWYSTISTFSLTWANRFFLLLWWIIHVTEEKSIVDVTVGAHLMRISFIRKMSSIPLRFVRRIDQIWYFVTCLFVGYIFIIQIFVCF